MPAKNFLLRLILIGPAINISLIQFVSPLFNYCAILGRQIQDTPIKGFPCGRGLWAGGRDKTAETPISAFMRRKSPGTMGHVPMTICLLISDQLSDQAHISLFLKSPSCPGLQD